MAGPVREGYQGARKGEAGEGRAAVGAIKVHVMHMLPCREADARISQRGT